MSTLSDGINGRVSRRFGLVSRMAARIVAGLRGNGDGGSRTLRHIETLPLGMKRNVFLIECDGERFLLAISGDSVSSPVAVTQRSVAEIDGEQP